MTRIKLIATDVDGTFLNQQRTYNHNRFAAQLNRLSSAGIRFVVASGNHLGHLKDVFAPTPQVQTFVAENGGLIVDHNRTLAEAQLPLPVVREVVQAIYLILHTFLISVFNHQNPFSRTEGVAGTIAGYKTAANIF